MSSLRLTLDARAPASAAGSAHGSLAVRSAIDAATRPPPRGSVAPISESVAKPAAYARGMTAMQERLAPLLDRLADVFDHTAELAEQHAMRLSDRASQAVEYERANRARDAAQRARTHAHLVRQRTSDN